MESRRLSGHGRTDERSASSVPRGCPLDAYERLSQVYDLEWGNWARQYVGLVTEVLARAHVAQARILDLGCGTGILAAELAGLGHSIVGMDASAAMIEVASRRACPGTRFVVQDMAEASWKQDFDLVTCTFDAFNYLVAEPRVQSFFVHVANLLTKSGLLLFDSNTEELYLRRHHGVHERSVGSRRFRQECHYDAMSKRASTVFRFEDGSVEEHIQRPWALSELAGPIAYAGLAVESAWSGFYGEQYVQGCERFICVVRKVNRAARGEDAN
jgi:SAM-dependent methyltransferase